jgi:hypothetical protein
LHKSLILGLALATIPSALLSRRACAECRISARRASLTNVAVAAGPNTFTLNLQGVPVAIALSPGDSTSRIDVEGPLRFEATYPLARLALEVAKSVGLFGGRIRLGSGAKPVWLGVEGDAMRASLQKMLGVETTPAVSVPCRAIGLGDGAPYSTPAVIDPPKSEVVGIGSGPVRLFVRPVAVDPLEIHYPALFRARARRPNWVSTEANWADGSRVRGWVSDRDTKTDVAPGISGSVEGLKIEPECGRSDAPTLTRLTLRRGASIADSPGGFIWAHATKAFVVRAFSLDRPDGWIPIGAISGLTGDPCSELEHLWVHSSDVMGSAAKSRN